MITLRKAVYRNGWWEPQGEVDIDPASVESVEETFKMSGNGFERKAFLTIVMKSGETHAVAEEIDEVRKAVNK